MKATGIVRKVDQLGRMVIPKELRKTMDVESGTPLEVYINDDEIILKKYNPGCIFCGETMDVEEFKGKNICRSCLEEMK